MPRLSLSSEQFKLNQNGKIFSVSDLSEKGMALRLIDLDDLFLFSVGAKVSGILNIGQKKVLVSATVKHTGKELVGLQFEQLPQETEQTLKKLLDPKLLGQALHPIPAPELKGDLHAIWYHGPSGTEVQIWRDWEGALKQFAILVLGFLVQWDHEKGTQTGTVKLGDVLALPQHPQGVSRIETLLISPDLKLDLAKLQIAKTLLLSSNIPHDLKGRCLRHLE